MGSVWTLKRNYRTKESLILEITPELVNNQRVAVACVVPNHRSLKPGFLGDVFKGRRLKAAARHVAPEGL